MAEIQAGSSNVGKRVRVLQQVTSPHLFSRSLADTVRRALIAAAIVLSLGLAAFAAPEISQIDEQTIEVNDAAEMQVVAVAKTVIIKKSAKEVFVFGGDVIVEGSVTGDVGVIGGTIIQKEGGFIGGDVIAIGGSYKPDAEKPLRTEGKETIVFGILEDELRDLGQNPSQILSPSLTPAFMAQRLLSALFWFLITIAVTTIAPGAVSRAIARSKLATAKVAMLGLAGLIGSLVLVVASVSTLPDYLSVVVWLMVVGLLMLAYLFGRVTLQFSIGKLVQKQFSNAHKPNETVAILIGVLVWTVLLSLPYLWIFALLATFAAGVGLVLTARQPSTISRI
ncbi:MAG: hypothetical protein AB7V18_04300 [Pyrinomonadaceae bacterium]